MEWDRFCELWDARELPEVMESPYEGKAKKKIYLLVKWLQLDSLPSMTLGTSYHALHCIGLLLPISTYVVKFPEGAFDKIRSDLLFVLIGKDSKLVLITGQGRPIEWKKFENELNESI